MVSEEVYKEFKKVDRSKFYYLINYLMGESSGKFVLGKIGDGQDIRVYHKSNNTLKLSYTSLGCDLGDLELKFWGKDSKEILNNLTKLIEKK
ncbi:MAG: hypothetical protein AABX80_01190 [Nanoarchaeota archaeon]